MVIWLALRLVRRVMMTKILCVFYDVQSPDALCRMRAKRHPGDQILSRRARAHRLQNKLTLPCANHWAWSPVDLVNNDDREPDCARRRAIAARPASLP